jgi:nucleoside-diphosphate-sugar epimerase
MTPKKKKAALVTGGAGFIGSYLAEELLSQGYRVYAIDNLSTGSLDNIKVYGNIRISISSSVLLWMSR